MARYAIEYISLGYRYDSTPIFTVLLRFIGSSSELSVLILPINLNIIPQILWSIIGKLKLQDIKYNVSFLIPNLEYLTRDIDIEDYYTSESELWFSRVASKIPKHSILLALTSTGNGILYFKYLKVKGLIEKYLKNISAITVSDNELLEKTPYKWIKNIVDDILIIRTPLDHNSTPIVLEYLLQTLGVIKSETTIKPLLQVGVEFKSTSSVCRLFCSRSGYIVYHVKPGERVERGQIVAEVKWFFSETLEQVKSPSSGLVVALRRNSMVKPGNLIAELVTL